MHGKQNGDFSGFSGQGMTTLADMLDRRAQQFPRRVAFVYESESGECEQWTYGELHKRALAISRWLADRTERGDRALLVYPPGLDFIACFFGCVYASVLPVPATYPKPRRPLSRAEAIARDCQPKLALTHSSILAGINWEQQSPAMSGLAWEATDEVHALPSTDGPRRETAADALAFLQYTSGSTAEPRGVMISHQNVLHNLESIRVGFQISAAEQQAQPPTGVFWLPAYHDMGLIGCILTPIYVGATTYLMAPNTFLRRPMRWLELISETQAEVSGSPNFGYELAVQKTSAEDREKLDLRNWRLAFCGAEPIAPDTLRDFAAAFGPAGFRSDSFYPCYGMAEVTLLLTGGEGPAEPNILHVDRGQLGCHRAVPIQQTHPQAHGVVGCGATLDGQTLKIVEPRSRDPLPEGRVGEIWVRGGSVARGYWNQEGQSRETFQARLASEAADEFLRTGDLGFCWEGQLFVTGRLKDVIIVRGSNYYPQDIERTAQQAHAAVGEGVAFSVPGDRSEYFVVVHQVRREFRKADLDGVMRAIRAAITAEHDVDPGRVVLIKPASLPITSSGKVQRNRCRELLLAGELAVLAEWQGHDNGDLGAGEAADAGRATAPWAAPVFLDNLPSIPPRELPGEVQAWLIEWLTGRAHLNPGAMRPATPFAELGIDSLTAVEISQELESVLELQLPPMVVWSFPTVEALAIYLAEQLLAAKESNDGRPQGEQVVANTSPID